MTRRRQLGLATALVGLLLLSTATAADATRRYAHPNGRSTGSNCTLPTTQPGIINAACTLRRAVEQVAVAGDEVLVLPGTHSLTGNPITADVPLTIQGAVDKPRPRVVQNSSGQGAMTAAGPAAVRHLQLEAPDFGLLTGGAEAPSFAEDLVVAVAGGGVDLGGGWTLRNSLIRAGTIAVATSSEANVRNVTAIATDSGSRAMLAQGNPALTAHLTAKNVIARGGAADLEAGGFDSTHQGSIDISFSNYRASMVVSKQNGSVNDQGNNQENFDPIFVNAAGGDFHQLAGSPTIDAGTTDSLIGATDFDGDARSLGAAPDIGADEYIPGSPGGGDPGGGDGGGDPGTTVTDNTVPVAKGLKVKPKNVEAAASGDSIAAATGATVSYTLSELGQVTFTVERAAPGRRKGKKCVKPRRRNRKAKACTRYVKVKGSFDHAAVQGQNSFRFTGRLNSRKLKRGGYRLVGTPIDIAANRGKAVTAKFNIKK